MPYWRHLKSTAPSIGQPFGSMVEARDGIDLKNEIVTFEPTVDETDGWHSREIHRFGSNEYLRVPWIEDAYHIYSVAMFPAATHYHFPHRSVKSPGLIAYTKNDEHGVNDRQTSVRPGRYLEEFFKDVFTAEEIAEYANRCKAETLDLKIARSEAEIVAIYSLKNCGFSSCMQLKHSPEYDWQRAVENGDRLHPVAVYGDSDLGVAYLGDIDTKVTARCVVWPDKKQYTRVYGDTTLTSILQGNGYRHVNSLDGARVRYIESGEGVIMPYIDGIGYAMKVDDKWIDLGCHEEDSDYNCQNTSGYGDVDRRNTCARCDEDTWDDLTATTGGDQCDSCIDLGIVQCAAMIHVQHSRGLDSSEIGAGAIVWCDNDFHELRDFDANEQTARENRHVTAYCATCAEHKQLCQHCGELFDDLETQCTHCSMAVRCDHTASLLSTMYPEFAPITHVVEALPVGADGSQWWAEPPGCPYSIGGFWVKLADGSTHYTDCFGQIRHTSHFDTLDNCSSFVRVPDPRMPPSALTVNVSEIESPF